MHIEILASFLCETLCTYCVYVARLSDVGKFEYAKETSDQEHGVPTVYFDGGEYSEKRANSLFKS